MTAPPVEVVESTPRDVKIALAHATIEGCLLDDDQLEAVPNQMIEHPSVVMFRVACPGWNRGADLAHDAKLRLGREQLEAWTALIDERGETRVEIRVVVGEADRKPAGAP